MKRKKKAAEPITELIPSVTKSNRRSKSERESQLGVMEQKLVCGKSPYDIAKEAVTEFGISLRHAWRDMNEIKKRWRECGEESRKERMVCFARAIKRREFLYSQAVNSEKWDTALSVEKDLCCLQDLYSLDIHERMKLLEDRLYGAHANGTSQPSQNQPKDVSAQAGTGGTVHEPPAEARGHESIP